MWNQPWPTVGSAMPPLPTQTISAQPPLPTAPPPAEPSLSTTNVLATPIAPTAMANPYGQYTPAQYAALTAEQQFALQQHWQQWQAYQQEYAKWHAQYGEQYNREMAAAAVYQPPPLPAQPPPLPPNAPLPDALPDSKAALPNPPEPPAKSTVKITAAATMYNNSAQQTAPNATTPLSNTSPWFAASNRVDYVPPNRNQQSNNSWSQSSQNNQQQNNNFMNTSARNSENFGNNQNRNNFSNPSTKNDNNWSQVSRNNANFNQHNRMMSNNNMNDFGNEGRFGGGFNADNQRNNNVGWGRNGPVGSNQNQNNNHNNSNKWQGNNNNDRQNRWGNNNNQYNNNNMRNFDANQEDNNMNRNTSNFNQGHIDRGDNFNRGRNDRGGGNFNRGFNQNKARGGGSFNERDEGTSQGPNENKSFALGSQNRAVTSNQSQQAKPDMTEEIFDRQFRAWEDTFEDWKVTNANNPDREWYNRMLQQFENQRKILIEKRNQIRQRRMAQMGGQPSPQKNATQQQDVVEEHATKQLEKPEDLQSSQQIETKKCQTQPEKVDESHYDRNENEIEAETLGNEQENAVDDEEEEPPAETTEMSYHECPIEERKRKLSVVDDESSKHKSLRSEQEEEEVEHIITINLDDDEVAEESNNKMTDLFGRSEGIPGLDLVEGGSNLFAPQESDVGQESNKNERALEKINKMPEVKPIETGKEENKPLEANVEEPQRNLTQQIQESSVGNLPIVINALRDPDMLQNIIQVLAKVQGLNAQDGNPAQGPTEQVLQQLPGLLQKLQDQRQNAPGNQGAGMPFRDYQHQQPQQHQQQQQQFMGGRQPNLFGQNGPPMNFGQNQFGSNFEQMSGPGNRPQNIFGPMGGPQGNFTHNFGGFGGPPGQINDMGSNFDSNQPPNFRGNGNNFQNRRGGPNAPNFDRPAGGPNFNMQRPGPLDVGNNFARSRHQNQNQSNPFRRNNGPRGGGPQSGNQWTRYVFLKHFLIQTA